MKYFIVSDVHGYYDQMISALGQAGFDISNPNHIFVSCGDLLDRGEQPLECLNFVMSLPTDRRLLIRGNHEDLIESLINRHFAYEGDYSNGTAQTLMAITHTTNPIQASYMVNKCEVFNQYMNNLKDYFELQHYILVHGWIPCKITKYSRHNIKYSNLDGDWREAHYNDWYASRWVNGMAVWNAGVREPGKTIVCGHFHTSWGHCHIENSSLEWNKDNVKANFSPFVADGIMAIDACTAYSNQVNCVVVEDDELIDG